MRLSLLGETLAHSRSPEIHRMIFKKTGIDGQYGLCEVKPDDLPAFMRALKDNAYDGINVTIPYKTAVIPYLDALSDNAKAVGAVNTVVHSNGRLTGHNTDYDGFGTLLKLNFIDVNNAAFTVLGTGGAARGVLAYLDDHGAGEITLVSRRPGDAAQHFDLSAYRCSVKLVSYDAPDLTGRVLVNATPLGMFPRTDASPIAPETLSGCAAVVDLVYNPETTTLMRDARAQGIQAAGGLAMLAAQAVRAQEIWQGKILPDALVRYIARRLSARAGNLVLIGMPGCGKTTVGRALAQKLNMPLFDMDDVIVSRHGDIPSLFMKGEAYFRAIESGIAAEAADMEHTVICTGGGIVKEPANMTALAQNGTIVFIDRPVEAILSDIDHASRPLLDGKAESLTKLYDERIALYRKYAHIITDGSGSIETIAASIENAWNGGIG